MIRSSELPAPLSVAVSEGGDGPRSTSGALSSEEGGSPAPCEGLDDKQRAAVRKMVRGLRFELAWITGRDAYALPRTFPADMYEEPAAP